VRSMRVSLILFTLCATALVGCQRDEGLQEERVIHEDREAIHLRVAIIKNKELMWFFRLSGPEAEVKEHSPAFDEFVRTAKFEGKSEAILAEPKTWKKDPPGGRLRYAGYRLGAKPKELEVIVSRLPSEGYKLLENIHRWQRQINEPLAESEEDARKLIRSETIGDREIDWVDLKGLAVHSVSKPPDRTAQNTKKLLAPLQPKKRVERPFTYEVPKKWEKGPPVEFALESFLVKDGANVATVTLTAAGGSVPVNINRWRTQQLKLEPLSDAELRKTYIKMIPDIEHYYVDITGPNAPPQRNRILGVVIPLEDEKWFVKMTGPAAWVEQNKADFDGFLKSFKLAAP
jgi:hypothetical protein